MFIPLKDLNPTRTYPFVNITLILANIVVFIYELGLEATLPRKAFEALLFSYSTVPARFPPSWWGHASFEVSFMPLFTSMFLQSGFLHLAGNMLFLWIFGDNVEDFFGHIPYLFFYLGCGIGAGLLHVLFNLHSNLPALGASGAISGVDGRLHIALPRGARSYPGLYLPFARACRGLFGFVVRHAVLAGIDALGRGASGGVAWWAHIGGFLLGMLLTAMAGRRR